LRLAPLRARSANQFAYSIGGAWISACSPSGLPSQLDYVGLATSAAHNCTRVSAGFVVHSNWRVLLASSYPYSTRRVSSACLSEVEGNLRGFSGVRLPAAAGSARHCVAREKSLNRIVRITGIQAGGTTYQMSSYVWSVGRLLPAWLSSSIEPTSE